ncbi:hypothetical protein VTJ83DRAFT_2569 [Remersonia thermophila]|uniref:PUM-HD domain-containing protein n=1 Tax=Remersonia thermophila TaxID=72144 RepID=A0ABR4DJ57_9PEZI
MANNTRRSRFSDYTGVPRETQSTQPAATNGFLNRNVQVPWNNDSNGAFATGRDGVSSRDAFNSFTAAAFASIAATSSADKPTWGSSYWNTTDTKPSGNTSPRTRPEPSGFPTNPYGSIFAPSSNTLQTSAVGSRPSTMASMQPTNGGPRFGFAGSGDSGPGDQFSTQDLDRSLYSAPGRRQVQDQLAHGLRNSISGRQESDYATQPTSLSELTYMSTTATPIHSQRPSISGPSLSQQGAGFDQTPARQGVSFSDALSMLSLTDVAKSAAANGNNAPAYDGVSQNFQFNPVSQSWDNGQAYMNGAARDALRNGASFEKRGSITGRNSPAGSTYQTAGGLNSPRSFAGTPQINGDPWSRPVSRDPMLAADLARRGLADPYVQPSPAAAFFPSGYYPGLPQLASPFAAAYNDPRNASPMATFGIPMMPFGFGAGAIPTRPARDQDAGRAFRSPLLDEFRNSPRSRKWELQDIWGHIVEFCGDQHASRFIQSKLETANSEERARVFAEIEPNTIQLMKDVFGNYVMQKLFEHGDQVQKKVLASAMKGKVVDLSTQMYGCRVVQKALEHVLVAQQVELVKELEPELIAVSMDQHGNHVIQQAIALVPREHLNTMMAGFKGHICDLASHQYGCRVIQRVLEHGSDDDKLSMMKELHTGVQKLLTDMFGNYVIQHVLEKGPAEDRASIISCVTPQILSLSRHKNASNVVEKCIMHGTPQEQRAIRDQLLVRADEANGPLFQLMKDQYGNYVIQKLVRALQPADRTALVEKLAAHLPSLKRSGATSKQIEAMTRLVSESRLSESSPSSGQHTPTSTAPTSPGLRVDVHSASPTPNPAGEVNTPASSPSITAPCPVPNGVKPAADAFSNQPSEKQNSGAPSNS